MSEIKRKLTTIEKIAALNPIPGADAIEVATIRGWKVVVKKGEFQAGDWCVYCEIDSILPEIPETEFLAKAKYRIKTIRLRGQVSQGIAFPIKILKAFGWEIMRLIAPEKPILSIKKGDIQFYFVEGLDVTDIMGVTKYDPPIPASLGGTIEGNFPSHSQKTDEERIQNLVNDYPELRKRTWYETEKLDGSSTTYFIVDGKFGICSRNFQLREDENNSFWKVARRDGVEDFMRELMSNHNLEDLTLQGELIGEGVQGNKYRIKGQEVRFFNAWLPAKKKYLEYGIFLDWMSTIPLKTVPIVSENFTFPENYEDLILHVDGYSNLFQTAREGSVFVATEPDPAGLGRDSFKVISNKFILKYE